MKKYEKHGMSDTGAYNSWKAMRQRCLDSYHSSYKNYGGRGIRVCREWKESFVQFYKDMGDKPAGTTLDRIDNDGDYTPENCRWATSQEQASNKKRLKRRPILIMPDLDDVDWERFGSSPKKS